MIRREKVRAIIVSRKSVGEADRLVTLFTRSRGVLKVMAKGVRRIPSRRGGYLEPLTEGLCLITANASFATHGRSYLAAVEPLTAFGGLHDNETALEAGLVLAQAVVHLCEEGQAYETVFDGLHQALTMLPELSAPRQRILETALVLHILQRTGFAPHLAACQVCGQTRPSEAVVLDGGSGGWRCLVCHDSFAGTSWSLPPRLLRATQWLAHNPERALRLKVDLPEAEQLVLGVRRYLAQVIGAPLAPAVTTYARA